MPEPLKPAASRAEPPPIDGPDAFEDVYDLSPMQQGMLYHTIESPQPGMYSIVVSYRVEGLLDARALFDAWQEIVTRHPVLRTSFHWRDRKVPVQAVHRHARLPVMEHDWSSIGAREQQERLAALLESENHRGFDLTQPPLIRLTLVRCADDVHELVVAHHHLLLDGSCKPLLFSEVFETYEAGRARRPARLGRVEPYRRFIEWLGDQDLSEAEQFWRDELSGFCEPTPLWPGTLADGPAPSDYQEHHLFLDEAASDRLRVFARGERLTLNTIVSGAWALLLGHASHRSDVVFGATVNARPPTLDGAESMLGLFINTLPVRVAISPAMALVEWLRRAQLRQITAREFDYAPLSLIQRWSNVPRRLPLFESIVVFENNPGYGSESERHGSLAVTSARAFIKNSLPLTLRCVPARSLSMQLLYDTTRFSARTIDDIGDRFLRVLREMPEEAGAPVSRLTQVLDEVERARTAGATSAFQSGLRSKLWQKARDRRRAGNE